MRIQQSLHCAECVEEDLAPSLGMRIYMTMGEHRAVGAELSVLRNDIASAERLNLYRRNSITIRKLLRTQSEFDKLCNKLDDEMFERHPDEAHQSVYYGGQHSNEMLPDERTVDSHSGPARPAGSRGQPAPFCR
jgi:hypothetical protein